MKWAGGKRRLLAHILPHLDSQDGRYYEPFLGGGAVFFGRQTTTSILGDINPEVTNCYEQVRSNIEDVVTGLKKMKNSVAEYYHIRMCEPQDEVGKAVRTLYLMRFSFNGIYRQNLSGKFNVPYGYKDHLTVLDENHLRTAHEWLEGAIIRTGDFETTAGDAGAGDVVYLDPPYTVAHSNNGFVKYNARIFSWLDQRRLAKFAHALVGRGCRVVVSNADHFSVEELYPGFQRFKIPRQSVISASSTHRKIVNEALFVSIRQENELEQGRADRDAAVTCSCIGVEVPTSLQR